MALVEPSLTMKVTFHVFRAAVTSLVTARSMPQRSHAYLSLKTSLDANCDLLKLQDTF